MHPFPRSSNPLRELRFKLTTHPSCCVPIYECAPILRVCRFLKGYRTHAFPHCFMALLARKCLSKQIKKCQGNLAKATMNPLFLAVGGGVRTTMKYNVSRIHRKLPPPLALQVFFNDMRYINSRFTYLLTYLTRYCSAQPDRRQGSVTARVHILRITKTVRQLATYQCRAMLRCHRSIVVPISDGSDSADLTTLSDITILPYSRRYFYLSLVLFFIFSCTFSALTLLLGRQKGHPDCRYLCLHYLPLLHKNPEDRRWGNPA